MAKKKRKLLNMNIFEVSLVDKGANKRDFFFRKAEDESARGFSVVSESQHPNPFLDPPPATDVDDPEVSEAQYVRELEIALLEAANE